MLQRIKKIQNIGRFKSCSSSSVPFEKITLIFGRNTYGKSTLSDLFSSVATGDVNIIKSRKTIPHDPQSQHVELSFKVDDQQGESLVKYQSGTWQPPLPTVLKLHVFDDSFYHTNLFTGRKFTRETKDNFSSFVLGTQGVAKQQEIEQKNKDKRGFTKQRNELERVVFKNINNLPDFIELSPTESKDKLNQTIDSLRIQYSKLNEQLKKSSQIQERKECHYLNWENDFPLALQKLNSALQESLQWHYKEAQRKVTEHIKFHFKESQNAENWIRQGLVQNNNKNCQFCGQNLSSEALQLLDSYRKNFDSVYEEYDRRIKSELYESRLWLIKERILSLKLTIEINNGIFKSYPELDDNESYCILVDKITLISSQLNEKFEQWEEQKNSLHQIIDALISEKAESPSKAINSLKLELILAINEKSNSLVIEYNEEVISINKILQEFKKSVIDNSLIKRLKDIESNGKIEARKLQRLELSEQCLEYKQLNNKINELNIEIPKLIEELSTEQSDFLEQYFFRLNYYFQLFGSHDFELKKESNTRGDKPIYSLDLLHLYKTIS
jgi:hypothetical protein